MHCLCWARSNTTTTQVNTNPRSPASPSSKNISVLNVSLARALSSSHTCRYVDDRHGGRRRELRPPQNQSTRRIRNICRRLQTERRRFFSFRECVWRSWPVTLSTAIVIAGAMDLKLISDLRHLCPLIKLGGLPRRRHLRTTTYSYVYLHAAYGVRADSNFCRQAASHSLLKCCSMPQRARS